MQEGQTIVRIQGVITQLRGEHGETRDARRRRFWGDNRRQQGPEPLGDTLRVHVDMGTDDVEELVYEVPAEVAQTLRIGQKITIEIKMGATP